MSYADAAEAPVKSASATSIPVYKRILDLFEAEGINTLYGIPDPNFVHMFLEAENRGWTVVSPHHEASAGHMAAATARMTGKPALCIGTLGPGLANLMPAIQCAKVENDPIIIMGGQRARVTERRVRRGRGRAVEHQLRAGGGLQPGAEPGETVRPGPGGAGLLATAGGAVLHTAPGGGISGTFPYRDSP